MSERSIIHFNVADFAVAVERLCDSRLRGRPLLVVQPGSARAPVYDMSEEAFGCGVRKGMDLGRALKLCPEARLVAPHPERYRRAMADLLRAARPWAPRIEVESESGHLFLDVTGCHRLFGPPPDVAWRLGRLVRRDLGLSPIWTVGPNKLVAKVASRLVKPLGEYIVGGGEEEAFLAPRPLHLLPGIEGPDLLCFHDFGLYRAGQVAAFSARQLAVPFGRRGSHLYDLVRGIDPSPVAPWEEAGSLGFEACLAEDSNDPAVVERELLVLAETAAGALRRLRRVARRLTLSLIYSDGGRAGQQAASSGGSANDAVLFDLARGALLRAWKRRQRLRFLRLACDRLAPPPPLQLELFPAQPAGHQHRRQRVADAVAAVRERCGAGSIGRAHVFAGSAQGGASVAAGP